jgi:hypothetical protein
MARGISNPAPVTGAGHHAGRRVSTRRCSSSRKFESCLVRSTTAVTKTTFLPANSHFPGTRSPTRSLVRMRYVPNHRSGSTPATRRPRARQQRCSPLCDSPQGASYACAPAQARRDMTGRGSASAGASNDLNRAFSARKRSHSARSAATSALLPSTSLTPALSQPVA